MTINADLEQAQLDAILEIARQEDLGQAGDLTSLLMPETVTTATGTWELVARDDGRFCGVEILPHILKSLAPEVHLKWIMPDADGRELHPGTRIARFSGRVCQMLPAERTILNFLQHLSGIATLTHRFVAEVIGTHCKIMDTRKTTPGLRMLEKYAVRCGGGHNHRIGLFDAVLIKDNHLAGIPIDRLAHTVTDMIGKVESLPRYPAFVEVECDTLEQFAELLKVVDIDVILLDNFEPSELARAVEMRDQAGLRGKIELEASGRALLDNVRTIAQTGVERIAVGAITHSAPILDVGLDAV